MCSIAEGVSTWQQITEKFLICSFFASSRQSAVGGVVVSKPIAKNTTWRSGLSRAICSASIGE